MVNFWPPLDLTIQPLLLVNNGVYLTTGNPIVAECRPLCRVPKVEHSATREYTECYPENTRQHFDTRQICLLPSAGTQTHGKIGFCRVPCLWHSAKTARARHVIQRRPNAVTEVVFAECLNSGTRQMYSFAECQVHGTRHSTLLPSVRVKALGKLKKNFRFYLPNILFCYYTSRGTTYRNLVYFCISFVYVINLFH